MKKTKREFEVRFNLSKGVNFEKWKVTNHSNGDVNFYEPSEVSIFMEDCFLRNQKGGATKIHNRVTNKTVVAWVEAVDVMIVPIVIQNVMSTSTKVGYNPHKAPNWVFGGLNYDSKLIDRLFTSKRTIFKGM